MRHAVRIAAVAFFFASVARADDAAKAPPKRALVIHLAAAVQALDPKTSTLALGTHSGNTFTMSGAELGTFFANVFELSIRFRVGPVSFGPLLGLGPAWVPHVVDQADKLESFGTGIDFQGGLAVNVALPRWGRLAPHVELAGGVQAFSVSLFHPNPANARGGVARTRGIVQPLLEPRASLDVSLGPRVTLSFWAGLNLLQRGEPAAGLAFDFEFPARKR